MLYVDFNSGTDNLIDFITNNEQDSKFDLLYVGSWHSTPKVSKDPVINASGRKLIEPCISHNLKIVT